jgi:HEAT repeat protein
MSMDKQIQVIALFVAIAGTVTVGLFIKSAGKLHPLASFHSNAAVSSAHDCVSEYDISAEVKKLSQDSVESQEAVRRLLILARTTPTCRAKTIEELVRAMNKPDLNFQADRPSFFLWSNGGWVLGELKAVEALDFLIDHSNLNDGEFSASMSHQPVVGAIIKMGTAAVPKLSDALKQNQNRGIRLTVALCLSSIGSQEAKDGLKQVLATESDKCVRRFVEFGLANPTVEVLRERLLAYRCGE